MLGNYGTMAVNINDFARYSSKTRSVYVQILIIPLSFALMSFMGIIIAGAATDLYGKEIWDPLTVLSHWTGSSRARAGAAFCGLALALAQLGTNLSANCISAANDLNAMFPKVCSARLIRCCIRALLTDMVAVHQPTARKLYRSLRGSVGADTMEHPRLRVCAAKLYGWLHYLGEERFHVQEELELS